MEGVTEADVEAEAAANREEFGVAVEALSFGLCCSALFFLAACFCSAMAIGDLMSRCKRDEVSGEHSIISFGIEATYNMPEHEDWLLTRFL